MRLIDMTGQKFGQLTVLERVKNRKKKIAWKCVCDCGKETEVMGIHLRSGHTQSCGCLVSKTTRERMLKHGRAKRKETVPEYSVWLSMKARCYRKSTTGYENYGGRGIRVCERWLKSFKAFYEDMGPRPSPLYSIERVDNDGNYEPSNCVWATKDVQNKNQRVRTDNTSGVRGVTWHKRTKQWMVQINDKYKHRYIGIFRNFDDAVQARKEAEKKYWGDEYAKEKA